MKLTVLGATGATGAQIVDQALAAGHEVTVLVRDSAKLANAGAVRVVVGDATVVDDVKRAIDGADAVLSALGGGNDLKSDVAGRAAPVIVEAAEATGVGRVVVLSAFGVGESRKSASGIQKVLMGLMMKNVYQDKAAADDLLRRSSLDWTLVYPVTLSNGPFTGTYTASEAPKVSGLPKVSRADVADFMIAEAVTGSWSRRTAVLTP